MGWDGVGWVWGVAVVVSAVDFSGNLATHRGLCFNTGSFIARIPPLSSRRYTVSLRGQKSSARAADLHDYTRNCLFPRNASAALRHCSYSRYGNIISGIRRSSAA